MDGNLEIVNFNINKGTSNWQMSIIFSKRYDTIRYASIWRAIKKL